MSAGYPRGTGDGLDALVQQVAEIRRRLRELEIPTGTQNASLVAQVQAKLAELTDTVNELVASAMDDFYTKAVIDVMLADIEDDYEALVASPGNIAPGTVTASGNVTAGGVITAVGDIWAGGDLIASGRIRGGNVYGNILSVDYRNVYVTGVDGALGHVPSSERFKQDIETYALPADVLLQLRLVTFRYKDAVEQLGADAQHEIGLIAEEVHALGLYWLVDYETRYTADGAQADPPYQGEVERIPFGVKYERLVLALLPWMQSVESRLSALEG